MYKNAEWEIVERIAKESAPRIVEEAGVQGAVAVGEVDFVIKGILLAKNTRAELLRDVKDSANEWLRMDVHYRDDANRILMLETPELPQLEKVGVDYGPLQSWYEDGEEGSGYTIESAIRKGIVENWGHAFAYECAEKFKKGER